MYYRERNIIRAHNGVHPISEEPIEITDEKTDDAEKELVHENTPEAKKAQEKKLGIYVELFTLTMSNIL